MNIFFTKSLLEEILIYFYYLTIGYVVIVITAIILFSGGKFIKEGLDVTFNLAGVVTSGIVIC